MRPQDILILLKILYYNGAGLFWNMKEVSLALNISGSEVSESLNRSVMAGLIDDSKKSVNRLALSEFIIHGIRYVFPQSPGPIVRGTKTAHSAPPLSKEIASNDVYVWPDPQGWDKGQAIEPLYPSVIKIVKHDQFIYECLALIDVFRVGKAREQELAKAELNKQFRIDGK
ncbi:MAG: hypothetical protein DI539_24135 [Flavobacterium psychrophilum]|nr:MAG: hypothetical protein DI539_24135 [Flavobacterium psychrophilum]